MRTKRTMLTKSWSGGSGRPLCQNQRGLSRCGLERKIKTGEKTYVSANPAAEKLMIPRTHVPDQRPGLLSARAIQIAFSTLSIHLHQCEGGSPPSNLSSRRERSGVEGLRFHFRQKRMCRGRIASRFRFSIKASHRARPERSRTGLSASLLITNQKLGR